VSYRSRPIVIVQAWIVVAIVIGAILLWLLGVIQP